MAQQKKQKRNNIITLIFQGRILSSDFFQHNWHYVAGVIILIIVFISNKYKVQTQMEQIIKLTKELNNAKTEMVKASSEYNSRTREPAMRELIDTMHIDLEMPEQPPYKL